MRKIITDRKYVLYVVKEKKAEAEVTKKAVKNQQSKVEKSTLGDLGVLAGLKAKMDKADDAEPTA